jgi:hypothetical protein
MLILKILDYISFELCFIRKYHKGREVRICTTLLQESLAEHFRHWVLLLWQGLYTLQMVGLQLFISQHSPESWMSDTHFYWWLSFADSRNFILNIQNIVLYFSSRRSWSSHADNMTWKFPCPWRRRWILTIVFYLNIYVLLLGSTSIKINED